MDDKNAKKAHCLILNDRKTLSLTGVTDVGSFDEDSITLFTDYGLIQIKGERLQVNNIDTVTGQFEAEGKVVSVFYSENKQKNQSFFSKVFK